MGRIYSGDKLYTEAIAYFRKALHTDPHFSEAQMELGLTLRRQADQEFEVATKGKTQEQVGEAIEQRNNKYHEAIRLLEEAKIALPGDEDILGALGGIYRRWGVYSTALLYYRKALKANPNSSYALGNVASLSYHAVERQDAREAFEKTILLATERIDAHDSREAWWDYYDRAMAKMVLKQIGNPDKKAKDEAAEATPAIQAIPTTPQSAGE